jgi:hypothetical protein
MAGLVDAPGQLRSGDVGVYRDNQLIHKDAFITIPILAEKMMLSRRSIERNNKQLQDSHRIERAGPTKKEFWEIL